VCMCVCVCVCVKKYHKEEKGEVKSNFNKTQIILHTDNH